MRMAKIFRNTFLTLLFLNFLIKGFAFISSNTVAGKVTGLRESFTIENKKNRTEKQKVVAPEIEYNVNGEIYSASERYWGYVGNYKVGEELEIIYWDDPEDVDLNGFFQFWITVTDIGVMFGITVLFTIVLETIRSRKKNPEA